MCVWFSLNGNHLYQLQGRCGQLLFEGYALVSVICDWEGVVSGGFNGQTIIGLLFFAGYLMQMRYGVTFFKFRKI